MLSDSNRLSGVQSRKRRTVSADTNKHWSDSQKIEAVTTYLALGNLVLTSSVLKIPEMTLRTWKQKEWWKKIEEELADQDELQLSARIKKIVETTLAATEDRIKHGDWIYNNKEGTLMRNPVNLRDVHKVTLDMIDKREHIMNKGPVNATLEGRDDRLKKLAAQFEHMSQSKRIVELPAVTVGE